MAELDDPALLRYSRHILLPQIDIAGQQRLLASRVLIVGVGGLGSPAALYLASAGVGHLTLADGDQVELSNLQRQIAHDMTGLGRNKAESAADGLRALNPDIDVVTLPLRLDAAALHHWVAQHDVVLDCSDNFATRHAINRVAVACGVPLVSGAAMAFDGQLAVFDSRQADSPCYCCLFPEQASVQDESCATFGVLAPLAGVIGSLQAAEALKLLLGMAPPLGQLLLYDGASCHFRHLQLPRDPACAVCAPVRAASG